MRFQKTIIYSLITCLFIFEIGHTQKLLIDENATKETVEVYSFLAHNSGKHLLFGHHKSNISGIEWQDKHAAKQKSDVKSAIGDFPAVFSFDFNKGFEEVENAVKHAHKEGAIITFSWHMQNLATLKNCYDTSGNVMERLLPNGDLHNDYLNSLNNLALFANNLKIDNRHIPIIYRPFHENTGNWFWWGASFCSPETYKKVWQFTVDYLKNEKNVHNLIYAYSPSKPAQLLTEDYETRYPGNEYVDIIGFDYYGENDYSAELIANCRLVVEFAKKNNKIAAITETGVRKGLQNTSLNNWYKDFLLEPIKNDSIARNVAFMVTWANTKKSHWVPLKNDIQYTGFLEFYKDDYTWFASDIKNKIYR